jgi:hypothetical protein
MEDGKFRTTMHLLCTCTFTLLCIMADNATYGRLTARVLLLWVCLYCFLTTVLQL